MRPISLYYGWVPRNIVDGSPERVVTSVHCAGRSWTSGTQPLTRTPEGVPAMTPRPTSVSTEMELRLIVPGGSPLPVAAGLQYEASDPYACLLYTSDAADD